MVNRITQRWEELGREGRKALIPYLTPDYPMKGVTPDLVAGLESAGASLIELGIPFSDPLADGPVIQQASQRALMNGATPGRVLEIVKDIRQRSPIPILLMGYVNPLLRIGIDAFFDAACGAGVDGFIIPDLPPEEASRVHASAVGRGLSMVYLIAPTTTDERIIQIDALSSDFSYCVSVTGVTGASARFAGSDALESFLKRVRRNAKKPFVVGFGIATSADVRRVWRSADGVVVGSQLLREIGSCTEAAEVVRRGTAYVRTLAESPQGSTEVI